MLFSNTIVGLVAVSVAGVSALGVAQPAVTATSSPFKVSVGADGLTYTPNNIIAEVGTEIEFSFFPKNHTVTQSSFKDPCHPLSPGGFFSGFVPTTDSPSGTTFTITVKDTKPIWFYCSQTKGTHCQAGMVGAINAAQGSGNTLDAFIAAAAVASDSTFPEGGPQGGELSTGSSATTPPYAYTSTYAAPVGTGTGAAGSTGIITATSTGTGGSPTTSPIVPANGASSLGSNSMVAALAVVLGAMALL